MLLDIRAGESSKQYLGNKSYAMWKLKNLHISYVKLVRYFEDIRLWSFCHRQYGKGRDKSYVTGIYKHSVCEEVVHFGFEVPISQYSVSIVSNRCRIPQGTEVPFVITQYAKKPSLPRCNITSFSFDDDSQYASAEANHCENDNRYN